MAKGLGTLTVWLNADTKGLASGFAQAQRMILSWKGALAGAIGGIGLGALAKDAVSAFMEAEDAGAQLQRVLESTNFAAGFNAKQIQDFAGELQKTTRYEDDAIAKGMALLATFTNIKGDNFKAATQAALDLSTVMGTDLQGSIVQIGKALNDPIKGISALSRVGVSFTEQQKQKIAELVATGKTYEAQLVILKELSVEFGGQAAAAANTTAGKAAQLKNALGDIKETFGELIVNVLDLNGLFGSGTGTLQEWGDAFKRDVLPIAFQIKSVFIEIKYAILQTVTAIGNIAAPIMSVFETAYTNISNIIGWVWDNLGKLAKGIPQLFIAAIKDTFQAISFKDLISGMVSGKTFEEAAAAQIGNLGKNIENTLAELKVSELKIASPDLSGWGNIVDDIEKLAKELEDAQDSLFNSTFKTLNAKGPQSGPSKIVQDAIAESPKMVAKDASFANAFVQGSQEAYNQLVKLSGQGRDQTEAAAIKKTGENTTQMSETLKRMQMKLDALEVVGA